MIGLRVYLALKRLCHLTKVNLGIHFRHIPKPTLIESQNDLVQGAP